MQELKGINNFGSCHNRNCLEGNCLDTQKISNLDASLYVFIVFP